MLEVHELLLSTDVAESGEIAPLAKGSHQHLRPDTNLFFAQVQLLQPAVRPLSWWRGSARVHELTDSPTDRPSVRPTATPTHQLTE